ncbi:transposase [Clostridium gasigenes]|uniref:transposase n=1 Tax=Clostridium gasigenes TaxID=94869 RepID=UPI001C0BAD91|nr:transposase [Clostridium gasigenes]MBU3107902.1 transposase [Clostridium gasigenes]
MLGSINNLIKDLPKEIQNNIELVSSIPGAGLLTAITIISKIDDFKNFLKPKHLVAFFGIDTSINESGKFNGK